MVCRGTPPRLYSSSAGKAVNSCFLNSLCVEWLGVMFLGGFFLGLSCSGACITLQLGK
jgi:hypothetical protein